MSLLLIDNTQTGQAPHHLPRSPKPPQPREDAQKLSMKLGHFVSQEKQIRDTLKGLNKMDWPKPK